jgi:effector-binding domain-containing protein
VAYQVAVREIEAQPVVIARAETTPDKIGETYGELIGEVSASVTRRGIPTAGPAFARYFDYSKDHVDMALGFPVRGSVEPEGRVVPDELPGGRVAVVVHDGAYTKLPGAYTALEGYLRDRSLESAGPPWEVYVTGPAQGGESSTWRTEIVQPIT